MADDPLTDARPPASDIESWIGAILQTEHLSLLLGNGLTSAQTLLCGGTPPTMAGAVAVSGDDALTLQIATEAQRVADASDRGDANIEDSLRTALLLSAALRVLEPGQASSLDSAIESVLASLLSGVLEAERCIEDGGHSVPAGTSGELTANGYLVSFLLAFASRAPTRDRLGIFTTNYDRLVEYACDVAGLRVLDRFVGALSPEFRSSRVDVDFHYNPPGIRGEPRYVDGVVRLTKLHGSIDWRWRERAIVRESLPFGAPTSLGSAGSELMIYPNSAKDFETGYYPYADLFRDFSASLCRPNSALVTYGYGFGDDHINRVIADMLAIPSTHVFVIAYSDVGNRIANFVTKHARDGQVSILLGSHYGDLATLVDEVLPSPAADGVAWRRARLLRESSAGGTATGADHGTAN
jgi:SIR2-like domain